MKRPLIIFILLVLFFFLCKRSHATTLDLPGSIEASYDQRVIDKTIVADNDNGRQQVHVEQGFSDTRIKKYILGYVGYSLYSPNGIPADNHLQMGLRNQSLLPPFTLKLEYQTPLHQSVDTANTIVFSVSYDRNWNLIPHKKGEDE